MNEEYKKELCKMVAEGCEDVFQQVGYDLQMASGQDEFTAEEMVECIMNIAAFEAYAGDDAQAAFDLLTETYSNWEFLLKDVAAECRFDTYG